MDKTEVYLLIYDLPKFTSQGGCAFSDTFSKHVRILKASFSALSSYLLQKELSIVLLDDRESF